MATGTDKAQSGRMGPRPLGLHLSVALATWMSSRAGLPMWRSGSLRWSADLAEKAAEIQRALAQSGAAETAWMQFDTAVADECRRRMAVLHMGLIRYRDHPYRRTLRDVPAIWAEGTTRLLDFGAVDGGVGRHGPVVLFVPSLINRSSILDLSETRSLMRWLAGQGMRPLLVDWGAPGEAERDFGLADYVGGRLAGALAVATGLAGGRVPVVGYCMGGLLALALAARQPDGVARLALLATPWDFHVDEAARDQAKMVAAALAAWTPAIAALRELPADLIQTLFSLIEPMQVPRKFLALAALDPNSDKAAAFVALEDWLNDGVALAGPVADECLGGWYGENVTGRGVWELAGQRIDAAAIDVDCLAMIPRRDRIVPPASAAALANALPRAQTVFVRQGHIGMVVSEGARQAVWPRLADWLRAG